MILQVVVKNVTSKRGMKNYEVNIRSIYAMRSCGVVHTGTNRFCGLMNMPSPVRAHSYDEASNKIRDATEKVAKSSMIAAASDVKATDGQDIGVTVDGSWQRRGFSSLNGIVADMAVTSGNVLRC